MTEQISTLHLSGAFVDETSSQWTTTSRGKRLFDIVFSATMIIAFAPLMLTIAILIVVFDRGGVIFAHGRIGRGNRTFRCLKFRTMVRDADKRLEDMLAQDPECKAEWLLTRKLKNDPRIIPGIGKLLRKTSLDELPQLFNVLFGDMSIVGPRPIVKDELAYYGDAAEDYLSVRPGLTGPWQSTNRSDSSYETRVRQDVNYIRNGSLWTDVRIVIVTARKFLGFNLSGAY